MRIKMTAFSFPVDGCEIWWLLFESTHVSTDFVNNFKEKKTEDDAINTQKIFHPIPYIYLHNICMNTDRIESKAFVSSETVPVMMPL